MYKSSRRGFDDIIAKVEVEGSNPFARSKTQTFSTSDISISKVVIFFIFN